MFKILVVDDDEHSLKLMDAYLSSAGYGVTRAVNGALALDILRRERFDLLITDVGMPRIGGFRLLEEANRKYRLPAIVITATDADSEAQRKSFSLGALKFMLKPIERDEVLGAVDDILGKREEN